MPMDLLEINLGRNVYLSFIPCDGAQTTLFLFHGIMGSTAQWDSILPSLKCDYNICMYDALGCGCSQKPQLHEAYSPDLFISDAIAIFNKYSTSRNIIVGHSYGTVLAAQICKHLLQLEENKFSSSPIVDDITLQISNKNKIVGIVLLASALTAEGVPIMKLPLFLLRCMSGALAKGGTNALVSSSASLEIKQKVTEANLSNDLFVARATWTQLKWASKEDWMYITSYPLLIIHGKDDAALPLTQAQNLFNFIKDSHGESQSIHRFEVIEDCGHLIPVEKPEQLLKILKEFFLSHEI